MVIRHNMFAMNAERQLGIVSKSKADSMEKLSSGYRINRAADDAAGLSISEKMRRQIRGLKQGVKNTQEGVSVCQVADGALTEVSDMIQRISELSIKAANETNTADDRDYIQQEVRQLITEIDRIAETTTFNEIKLFDGLESFGGGTINMSKPSTDGKFFQLFGNSISKTGYMHEELRNTMVDGSTSALDTDPAANPYVSVHSNMGALNKREDLVNSTFFVNCCTDCCPTTVVFTDTAGVTAGPGKIEIGMKKADGSYYTNAEEFTKYIVDSMKAFDSTSGNSMDHTSHVEFAYKGSMLYLYDIDNHGWDQSDKEAAYFCDSKEIFGSFEDAGKKIWIHTGCEPGEGIWLEIGNMSTQGLGIKELNVSSVNGAGSAIDSARDALRKVMKTRSRIGAQQNRLEHTIANEENIVENLSAAESRIRDTDIATEMVRFSNINILEQAATSMLSQANQQSNYILQLLQ